MRGPGTGAAIPAATHIVAVELVATLARALEYMARDIRCSDFLTMNGELGTFVACKNEVLAKLVAHGLVACIHETHELGIDLGFNRTSGSSL